MRSNLIKWDQIWSNLIISDQIWSNLIKSNQIKSDQIRPNQISLLNPFFPLSGLWSKNFFCNIFLFLPGSSKLIFKTEKETSKYYISMFIWGGAWPMWLCGGGPKCLRSIQVLYKRGLQNFGPPPKKEEEKKKK